MSSRPVTFNNQPAKPLTGDRKSDVKAGKGGGDGNNMRLTGGSALPLAFATRKKLSDGKQTGGSSEVPELVMGHLLLRGQVAQSTGFPGAVLDEVEAFVGTDDLPELFKEAEKALQGARPLQVRSSSGEEDTRFGTLLVLDRGLGGPVIAARGEPPAELALKGAKGAALKVKVNGWNFWELDTHAQLECGIPGWAFKPGTQSGPAHELRKDLAGAVAAELATQLREQHASAWQTEIDPRQDVRSLSPSLRVPCFACEDGLVRAPHFYEPVTRAPWSDFSSLYKDRVFYMVLEPSSKPDRVFILGRSGSVLLLASYGKISGAHSYLRGRSYPMGQVFLSAAHLGIFQKFLLADTRRDPSGPYLIDPEFVPLLGWSISALAEPKKTPALRKLVEEGERSQPAWDRQLQAMTKPGEPYLLGKSPVFCHEPCHTGKEGSTVAVFVPGLERNELMAYRSIDPLDKVEYLPPGTVQVPPDASPIARKSYERGGHVYRFAVPSGRK